MKTKSKVGLRSILRGLQVFGTDLLWPDVSELLIRMMNADDCIPCRCTISSSVMLCAGLVKGSFGHIPKLEFLFRPQVGKPSWGL